MKLIEVIAGVNTPAETVEKIKKISGVFNRLMEAGQRLIGIIKKSEGMANKDLAKFADQINSLCDKWDR